MIIPIKIDNLEEMAKFLERHKLLKLSQEKNKWNSPRTSKEIEFSRNLSAKQTQEPYGFTGEF